MLREYTWKVKEGYEAVAALLKYQEAEFVKLKDTSNKTHTKLNTAMEEAEKPVSDIIQETKHNLDNVIATAGIKYDTQPRILAACSMWSGSGFSFFDCILLDKFVFFE